MYAFGVDGLDYLGDTHDPIGSGGIREPYSCLGAGTTTGVATEVDWQRFLWDLNAGEGVPFVDIIEAYADAAPESWDIYPARPSFAFSVRVTHGFDTEYDAQDDRNGVHR